MTTGHRVLDLVARAVAADDDRQQRQRCGGSGVEHQHDARERQRRQADQPALAGLPRRPTRALRMLPMSRFVLLDDEPVPSRVDERIRRRARLQPRMLLDQAVEARVLAEEDVRRQ